MTDAEPSREVSGFRKFLEIQKLTSPVWEIIIRPFTKWYFDVLKNVMLVAALQYLGEKTGNTLLKMVAGFSYILIATYFLSYINMWIPQIFNVQNKNATLVFLDIVFAVVIASGLMTGRAG